MADPAGAKDTVGGRSGRNLTSQLRAAPAAFALLAVAACSQVPQDSSHHSKIDPVWGVERAKKMVADGNPIPPGGGRYQVGKPYMVGGRMYFPREQSNYDQSGLASWYGADDHGRETANGEVYDKESISAAHTTLPIPSYARVTNLDNGRSIIVRINDRGPYVGSRVIDVSERTADLLQFKGKGLGHVRVQYVGPAPIEGSDQRMLVASLRTGPATITQDRTLIARADRMPSDGRMAALALEHAAPPIAEAPAKPMVLAVATERDLGTARAPVSSSSGVARFGTHANLPAPVARPTLQQIAIAPTTTPVRTAETSTYRAAPLGGLPARATASQGSLGTLAPLADADDEATAPLKLAPGPTNLAKPAPGAIARMPTPPPPAPSRYGPNGSGQVIYRLTQGYTAETATAPGQGAIDRLISQTLGADRPRIHLGSFKQAENAARVAQLMQPYGEISTTTIRGGLGEKLTRVELQPTDGVNPGDILSTADRLGIHTATLTQ